MIVRLCKQGVTGSIPVTSTKHPRYNVDCKRGTRTASPERFFSAFIVRCGSKDHDLFVSQRNDGVNFIARVKARLFPLDCYQFRPAFASQSAGPYTNTFRSCPCDKSC
jgi:hypothetical protein